MMRPTLSLCWVVPVFFLSACATTTDQAVSSPDATPSYRGVHQRPLSNVQPGSREESRARIHVQRGQGYLHDPAVIWRPDLALEAAETALKIKPGYPLAYHLMGLAYMELQQYSLADSSFRRALSAAPGDPEFNDNYGWFLCTQKRFSEAMPRFAVSVANPYYFNKSYTYTHSGRCLLENNELVQAEIQFSKALEIDSFNREAMYWLAETLYRRGGYQEAYRLLIGYHQKFDPSARSAWLGLRAARKLGERHTEASYAQQLRSRFAGSTENALMMQGRYE